MHPQPQKLHAWLWMDVIYSKIIKSDYDSAAFEHMIENGVWRSVSLSTSTAFVLQYNITSADLWK